MFNFEAFTCWIYTKEDGAQRDEKDKCYVETNIYVPRSKIPDYTLQKQMWDLLTAVRISKRYHQTIEKSNILGFGGNMFNF